jgi:osmotically-inducible protein OsmY
MKQSKLKVLTFAAISTLALGTALHGYAADDAKPRPSTSSTSSDQGSKEKSGSVGQYVDDATITTRVKSKFAGDSTVSATRIKVETVKGIVELSGSVASDAERDQAVTLARAVPDVKGVRNNLTVQGSANKPTKHDTTGRASAPTSPPTGTP